MVDIRIVITYNVKDDEFKVDTNAKDPVNLIEGWIRSQMGAGVDNTPAEERDVYTIDLSINLQRDVYTVKSDCGNKGLRDGILMHFIKTYEEKKETENVD